MSSEKKAGKKKLSLRYLECICESFTLTEYGKSISAPIPFDKYEYNFNFFTAVVADKKLVKVRLDLKVFEKKENSVKVEIVEMTTINGIVILNFEEVIISSNIEKRVNYNIPNEVIKILFGYSISATRGMMSVKLENTVFSNAVLPFIDSNSIFSNPGK